MNHYYCSNGERVTQSQIDRRYRFLKSFYDGQAIVCEGCKNQIAQALAHIIPKARAKVLHKTELIWDKENVFPACHPCNLIAENVSSEAITKLRNFEYIKEYLRVHDPERFNKLKI